MLNPPWREKRRREKRRRVLLEPNGSEHKPKLPFVRREADFAKLRVERWLELADTALHNKREEKNRIIVEEN